jgi:UDP-N-acetylglucosamine acyltransferase
VTAVVARPQKGTSLYGLNLIGLKRNRFTAEAVSALKKAYRILFRSGAPMGDALAKVEAEVERTPEVRRLLDFIRSSRRGVLR